MTSFYAGIVVGYLFSILLSSSWMRGKFNALLDRPCQACGRPSAVLAQVIDLETRQTIRAAILCTPCSEYGLKVGSENPPPWAYK